MRFVGLPAAVLALGAFFAAVTDRPGSAEGEAAIPATQVERAPRQIGTRDGAPLYRKEFLSPVYTVDAIYKSMMGPQSTLEFAVAPDVPEELSRIVMKAVEKENGDRYETATAMRDDLLAFADGKSGRSGGT